MKEVHFTKLKELDSEKFVVFTALRIDDTSKEGLKNLQEEMTEALQECNVFQDGLKITGISRITGNVLGDEGRHDYLLKLNKSILHVNPLARIMACPDLKWLSDFIDNFKNDFEEAV